MNSSETLHRVEEPGPAHYKTSRYWNQTSSIGPIKINDKKITNFRYKSTGSSTFRSTTERNQLTSLSKDKMPSATQYNPFRSFGSVALEGGAPNNFLLMKNDRLVAPFGSTVQKGWLKTQKGKFRLISDIFQSLLVILGTFQVKVCMK